MSEQTLMLRLPGEPSAVSTARRFVTGRLEAAGLEHLCQEAELAVSELTTNVVLHARTGMQVTIETGASTARVSVQDTDPVLPTLASVPLGTMSGRGLPLVAAVSAAWGIDRLPVGKRVWFVVGAPACTEAPAGDTNPIGTSGPDGGRSASDTHGPGCNVRMVAAGAAGPRTAQGHEVAVRVPDLPVAQMLQAKGTVEDVVRDLRLVLLGRAGPPPPHPAPPLRPTRRPDTDTTTADASPAEAADDDFRAGDGDHGSRAAGQSGRTELTLPADSSPPSSDRPGLEAEQRRYQAELDVARELDAAVEAFAEARAQLRRQLLDAASAGHETLTLNLRLRAGDALLAERYRHALQAAEDLNRQGGLAIASELSTHAGLREHYLSSIIDQLGSERMPGDRP